MKIANKTYGVSEGFPVKIGETWAVKERGRVAEKWEVIKTTPRSFTARIEYHSHDENEVYF